MTSIFPWLVVGFTFGLVTGSWFVLPAGFVGVPILMVIAFALAGRRWSGKPRLRIALLLFVCLGALHSQRILPSSFPEDHLIRLAGETPVDLEGILVEAPDIRSDRTRLTLEATRVFHGREPENAQGLALITVGQGGERFQYGDRIRLRCRLRLPEPNGNPGGFDRKRYLALQGILMQGFVPQAREILLIRHYEGAWLRGKVETVRRQLSMAMRQEFPSPARDIVLSLVTGEEGGLPVSLREAFSVLGLSHLLAISGLNFGLLAVMVYASARWILVRSSWLVLRVPMEKVAWGLSLPILLGYAGIAGMGPSVQRSLIMILALMLTLILDRIRDLYHALALAALAILIYHPAAIYDISFQLSFLAVLGILYAVPLWQELWPQRRGLDTLEPEGRGRRWLKEAFLVVLTSTAALLVTLPVSVFHFHRVPFMSLPANLVMVPATNLLVLPLALAGSALFLVWSSGGIWVLWVAAWLADWMAKGVQWGADVTGGGLYLPSPRSWEMVLFYGICVGLCHLHRVRWARWGTLGLVLTLGGIWIGEGVLRHLDKGLRVHCLSVGNGTSTLLEMPGGERILVDGGGAYDDRVDVGALQVAPFLWHRRIMGLDRVILSHPHPDHANGLHFVLRAFTVRGGIWDNGDRPSTEAYLGFREMAERRGWPPGEISRGVVWHVGEARIEVLNPPPGETVFAGKTGASRTNNRSAVLRVSLGDVSVLLSGDVEAEQEAWLAARTDLRSTVLLAPHHGSKSSSTLDFIQAVSPRCVVFSSQAGPRGLVNAGVLARYQTLGIRVFHTGEDGLVALSTDGRTLTIDTHLSRRHETIAIGARGAPH